MPHAFGIGQTYAGFSRRIGPGGSSCLQRVLYSAPATPKLFRDTVIDPPIRIAADLSCLAALPLTGVGYYTRDLFSALLRHCPEVDLQIFAGSAQPPSPALKALAARAGGFHYLRVPTRLRLAAWTTLGWPPIETFTGKVDLVHGGFHALPPSRGVPRLVTVFDVTALRTPETHTATTVAVHRKLLQHAVPRAEAVLAISQSARQDVIELFGADPDRVHVIYGGINPEEFAVRPTAEESAATRARFGIQEDYLLHLGTLEPRKNIPRLIDAYAQLRSTRPDSPQLVLAGGEGWGADAIHAALDRHALGDAIVRTGYLDRADAVRLLHGARAFVYPSLYEGFGLPVLEAMACRVPVLTSNVSSLPEVIGTHGVLVAPESVDAIAAGLHAVLDGAGDVDAAAERAARFTWEASAKALAKVYRQYAQGERRG